MEIRDNLANSGLVSFPFLLLQIESPRADGDKERKEKAAVETEVVFRPNGMCCCVGNNSYFVLDNVY